MATILFSRPSHDSLTSYLFFHNDKLIKFAKTKSHNVLDNKRNKANKANKKEIVGRIEKKKPKLIIFNGHGAPDLICGHNDKSIIKMGKNHKVLNNSIVYSLSCDSALELGKASVKDGTIAFIGYEGEFALGRDKRYDATPLKDKIGDLFLKPSNLLVESLIKGNRVKNAVEKCKQKMSDNISRLETSKEQEHQDAIPFLNHNYNSLVFHGDGLARI